MSDYYQPRPFLVIAASRSGSTFLAHCLDSHPAVSCERDSPLDGGGYWRKWFSFEGLGSIKETDLLQALWCRSGYRAAGFKLSYRQARRVGLEWLADEVNRRIIHLYRANPLRTVASSAINTAVRNGTLAHPHHTFDDVEPTSIVLDSDWFVAECHRYVDNVNKMLSDLLDVAEGDWLSLSYDLIVGEEGKQADRVPKAVAWAVCSWLDVEQRELTCDLVRVNPQPLHEIVQNWQSVEKGIVEDGRFIEWLEK